MIIWQTNNQAAYSKFAFDLLYALMCHFEDQDFSVKCFDGTITISHDNGNTPHTKTFVDGFEACWRKYGSEPK